MVGVQVDQNGRPARWPVVDAVAGLGREGVQPGGESGNQIGLRGQFHRGHRSVAIQRSGAKEMAAGEADDLRQLNVDHLRPEIARHIDLVRRGGALGRHDDVVQRLGDVRGIATRLRVGNHVGEDRLRPHLLKHALTDGLVGGRRTDQRQRRGVPAGNLHGGYDVRDAGPVPGDHHALAARGAGVAVGHDAGAAVVRAVPQGDARVREDVQDRHQDRRDDSEGRSTPCICRVFTTASPVAILIAPVLARDATMRGGPPIFRRKIGSGRCPEPRGISDQKKISPGRGSGRGPRRR